jgi:YD repeat-containing protein
MKRIHRSPSPRAIRLISLALCYSLLHISLAPFKAEGAGRSLLLRGLVQNGTMPRSGAPEGLLPNLDEVKMRHLPQPRAPQAIPSTVRSRRNPLAPRTVRRVGDPLPSPLPTPSILPSPISIPSMSPLPSPLVRAGGAVTTTAWSKSGNGTEDLLPYLLAWNHNYPTLYRSSNTAFQLHDLTGPVTNSSSSQWPPDGRFSNNAAFDFFFVPMPQAGSTRIVFTSNRDGRAQIYSMDATGSNLIRLTNNGSNDDHPRWSPNGTKILFQSDRDDPATGTYDIYVMNADGTGQTRLTSDVADDCNAVWSPDGSKIVFQGLRNGTYYQVFVMNADGTNQLNKSNGVAADYQPSWSPNGSKIAFASERDHAGMPSVYSMNIDGSSQTRLTFSSELVRDEQPAWSRNGTKIAFVSTRDANKEIYVMNADGSSQARLTNTLENDDSPYWSPDGTQIVFRSERERDSYDPMQQLWMMSADGSNQTLLAGNGFGDYSPSWSANSNQPPVANSGGPYSGVVAQNVSFSGSGSFDPDGSVSSYSWSFGDGGTGSGASLTHTYASAGTYTVNLTVTDNLGAQTTATTTTSITTAASEAYLANFNLSALNRAPYTNESSYWNDILRAAYPNGQSSMLLAVRELGKTLFESADYAARSRDNHWYVYDLYKTYLMRDPDPSGWSFWEGQCNLYGREQVRRAFDECTEFAGIVATLTPSGSPSSTVSSLASARVDPFNQPGSGLTARDAEWSVPLLSLPGRAGLDLGLSLSYSSMIWTRSGPYIYFDEDNGWPSPGFRLGFPTLQEKVFDAQAGRNVYLLISGGSRVSLRQLGTSNVYEAADSSYLQLTDYGSSLLLRTTDGTQLSYQSFNSEWRCTQIKDRNGNYITVNYDWLGHIATIIDTLARAITFNYDTNANLLSITQSWTLNGSTQTHNWATFGWTTKTIQPSFSGVMVVGATNGYTFPVITQVGLADGSHYTFEYNSSGQVNPIRSYRSDNVQRAYTAYDYDAPADDCPRLIDTHTWAENWTGINGVPQEVATNYGIEGNAHTLTVAGDPNGTLYKEFYGTGWQRGLVTQTEMWGKSDPSSPVAKQKWTTNEWTQDIDSTAISYQTNPRITESNIYDGTNHRRVTTTYTTATLSGGASCSLPSDTREYGGDASTVLRRSHVDYRMDPTADAAYLSRHILGLAKEQTLYEVNGGTETLMSKVGFSYDETGSIQGNDAPVSHENSYDGNFIAGRANLSSVKRYDTVNSGQWTVSSGQYNTAGAVIYTTDPLSHHTTVSYADSFSDGNNSRNTLAYPKVVTDADGYSFTVVYNFDFGAVTSQQTPLTNTTQNLPGPVQTLAYDAAGRVERVTSTTNNAYTRYVYGPNYVQSFGTVNTVTDEAYSIQLFDGAGRVTLAAGNHPGSDGGYSALNTTYDAMGRAIKQSNPTEVTSGWMPTGDDSAGWLFTQQTYDWKGRALTTTNPDGTTKEASYSGCGCAGGEVATFTDEGTIDAGTAKRRQRKVYSDVLGRTVKTEVLNWQGGSPYATTVNDFNARDQVKSMRQYQGDEASGSYQETTMAYDGYGRLKTKHVPQQDSGAATIWDYNLDDTVQKITDARGASATYAYNDNRRLVTGVSYSAPAGITPTASVLFEYDAVGNRTSMTDGLGSKSYNYNQLSQLTSETRTFTNVGSFTLSYDYNLAGELKKITDSTNMTIKYGYDNAGRPNSVIGSDTLYADVSNYASDFEYRAWGGLKAMKDGTNRTTSLFYNSKLQTAHFEMSGNIVNQDYDYYNDGRIKFVHNTSDSTFDRSYAYDHAARLAVASSGATARGDANGDTPYHETFGYDAFSNLTGRETATWSTYNLSDVSSYANSRRDDWGYDADGRNTTIDTRTTTFDAAGRQIQMSAQTNNGSSSAVTQTHSFDGDGAMVQEAHAQTSPPTSMIPTYYLASSALGGKIVEELNGSGQKVAGYVYHTGGQLLAVQSSGGVVWRHVNPVGTGRYDAYSGYSFVNRTELDPTGADVGLSGPQPPDTGGGDGDVGSNHFGGLMSALTSDLFNPAAGCLVNGFSTPCAVAMADINFGTGASGSLINNASVTMNDIAASIGVVFAGAGVSKITLNVSGTEGTQGHETIENAWTYAEGYGWYYGPTATAYSGVTATVGSVVSLAASISLRPIQPQNPGANPFPTLSKDNLKTVNDAIKLAQEMTKKRECDEALKAYGIPSLAALVNGMTPNGNVFDGRTSTLTGPIGKNGATESMAAYFKENKTSVGAAVFPSSVTGRGSVTFLGDYFFNPASIDWVAFQRAIIMMHESVHQVGGKGDAAFGSSKQLSEKIIEKCWPALKGKLGGVG